jgi:hypothetical protein
MTPLMVKSEGGVLLLILFQILCIHGVYGLAWVSGAWTGCDPALPTFLLVHIGSSLGMRRDCPWDEPHCRGSEGHLHEFYAHVQKDVCLCNDPDCIRSYHDTGVQNWWTFS